MKFGFGRRGSNWVLAAAFATFSAISSSQQSYLRKLSARSRFGPFFPFGTSRSVVFAAAEAPSLSYLDAKTSKEIDERLMTTPGFSLDQLMELAGLSVATAVRDFTAGSSGISNEKKKVLIVCGPGNNGGDGLVAARHLFHFGFEPTIVYPKPGRPQIFQNLVAQCQDLGISFETDIPEFLEKYDIIVDALFGFSFQGPAKAPFDRMIRQMSSTRIPVFSVDIPSGWHVEHGDVFKTGFTPSAIISLTTPKKCVESYSGVHYLGGRFLPPSLQSEYKINIPSYSGSDQIVRLSPNQPTSQKNDWMLYVSNEGYPYYYNHLTEESHWAQFEAPSVPAPASNEQISVVFSTASSPEEAKSIANYLVKKKLVACVNIVPKITSVYEWEGKIEESNEVMLVIKTRKSSIELVTSEIKRIHSYSVPEVISMDIQGGNGDYLDWVLKETEKKS